MPKRVAMPICKRMKIPFLHRYLNPQPQVAVIRLQGAIGMGGRGGGLSDRDERKRNSNFEGG